MARIVILGAGGHAREMADVVAACRDAGKRIEVVGFLDDDPATHGRVLNGIEVLGPIAWLERQSADDLRVVSGIGSPRARRMAVERALSAGALFETLVHPTAVLTDFVTLGVGVVVAAGCVLTNRIEIGPHSHLNRSANVGHDCRVGAYCHLAPGAVLSGNVTVGDGCDIGTNACVIQNVRVGSWTTVGAGAAVVRDLPPNATAVGVPARVIKESSEG
jgi:sugar O-acyltransferase (sialic acid O-acetyltransferase NeuD family)